MTPSLLFCYLVAMGGGVFVCACLWALALLLYYAVLKWANSPVAVVPSEHPAEGLSRLPAGRP